MRRDLEELVGGLVDHPDRRPRRDAPAAPTAEPLEYEPYPLRPQATVAIRARRASAGPERRQVA